MPPTVGRETARAEWGVAKLDEPRFLHLPAVGVRERHRGARCLGVSPRHKRCLTAWERATDGRIHGLSGWSRTDCLGGT
jgi:hypothetical protein